MSKRSGASLFIEILGLCGGFAVVEDTVAAL